MSSESYKHNFAKNLLAKWLREFAAEAGCDEYVRLPVETLDGPRAVAGGCAIRTHADRLSWRVNRDAPHWGVWTEYPVVSGIAGCELVWDEHRMSCREPEQCDCDERALDEYSDAITEAESWPIAAERSARVTSAEEHGRAVWEEYEKRHTLYRAAPPSYDECVARFRKAPRVIFDIAIQHKGMIVAAIEVVHKNGVSPDKAEFVNRTLATTLYATTADWILGQVQRPTFLRMVQIVGAARTQVA